MVKYSPWAQKMFPLGGVQGGVGPPNVILGPHNISETTRATRVKYKYIFR